MPRVLELDYVADPMCSWCWGFQRELAKVKDGLPGTSVRYVMGGLAPDSEAPMPEEIRSYVQNAWRAVSERTGASFNWDFWEKCEPRRSTYPACRAVIAAAEQDEEKRVAMFDAIQRAYYVEARNPSLASTLVELADELSLDVERFAQDLVSDAVEEKLRADFDRRRAHGATGFPSLYARTSEGWSPVMSGYATAEEILAALTAGSST